MTQQIYRCENKFGHGPYGNTADGRHFDYSYELVDYLPWIIKHNDIFGNHPTPERDGIAVAALAGPNQVAPWQCGFQTVEQMFHWFTKSERKDLWKKGYLFVLLETEQEVLIGKHQCVFHRPTSKIIRPLEHREVFP